MSESHHSNEPQAQESDMSTIAPKRAKAKRVESININADDFFDTAELFKVFSSPQRVAVIKLLDATPNLRPHEIAESLDLMYGNAVVILNKLKDQRVVKTSRQGRNTSYSLHPDIKPVLKAFDQIHAKMTD